MTPVPPFRPQPPPASEAPRKKSTQLVIAGLVAVSSIGVVFLWFSQGELVAPAVEATPTAAPSPTSPAIHLRATSTATPTMAPLRATSTIPSTLTPTPTVVPEPSPEVAVTLTPEAVPTPTAIVRYVQVTAVPGLEPTPWVVKLIATPTPGDTPTPVVVVVTATPTATPPPTPTPTPTPTPVPTSTATSTPTVAPSPTPTTVPSAVWEYVGTGSFISPPLGLFPGRFLRAEVASQGTGLIDVALVSPGGCTQVLQPSGQPRTTITGYQVGHDDLCLPALVVASGERLVVRAAASVRWSVKLAEQTLANQVYAPQTMTGTGSSVGVPILLDSNASLRLTSEGAGPIMLTLLGLYNSSAATYTPFGTEGNLAGGVAFRHTGPTGTYLPMVTAADGRMWTLLMVRP